MLALTVRTAGQILTSSPILRHVIVPCSRLRSRAAPESDKRSLVRIRDPPRMYVLWTPELGNTTKKMYA